MGSRLALWKDPFPNHKPDENRLASQLKSTSNFKYQPPLSQTCSEHDEFERDLLLSMGWPPDVVRDLEEDAAQAGAGIVQTAIASGLLKPAEFYGVISRSFPSAGAEEREYRLILPSIPAPWLLLQKPMPLPIDEGQASIALNVQAMPVSKLSHVLTRLREGPAHIKLLTRQTVINSVTHTYGNALVSRAVFSLLRRKPAWSAKTGLARWQTVATAIAAGIFAGACVVAPREALSAGSFLLSVFFLLAIGLRLFAVLNLLLPGSKQERELPLLADVDLPNYTVFVPLFREVAILPYLARALSDLDYPPAKLDIKIVFESIDRETIEAARQLPFPGNVDFIVVPDCEPRTKPKALNYALQFATGELAVIYDAEDRPEPDQLRKAATRFHYGPPELACLQARLDYFNANENWLSRQFTIEYASLFRGILPLLSRLRLPLPLGGTSNHFRTGVLRKLGAWDPFNVTEDADLGMRLRRRGYRTETLDSTTYEEACCQAGPWIKQRTRWLKGWIQTFGVHMREPSRMLRETGLAGFIAFQAYFAGIVVSSLAHPLFYALLAWDAMEGALFAAGPALSGEVLLAIAIANFIGGYAVNLALGALALRGTRHKGLWLHVLFIPIYWLFVSAAAYRAMWQLIRAPFYWEKTMHGVSAKLKG